MNKNSLSRSPSRMNTYEWCKRQYFLNYYNKFTNFNQIKNKNLDVGDMILIKKLSSFPNRIGNIIHQIIASFFERFKNDKDYTIEQYQEERFEKIKQHKIIEPYYFSANRDYSLGYDRDNDPNREKKYGIIGLVEHYYKEIPEEEHEKYIAVIINNIENDIEFFGKSKIYKEIKKNFDNYEIYHEPAKTDFNIKRFRSQNIKFGEIDLYVQPDFYLKDKNENKFIIIDRKTGDGYNKGERLPDQLLAQGYRLYVENGYDEHLNIEGYYCNLENNGELSTGDKVGIQQIKEYEAKINSQINELADNLKEGDYIENIPLGMENFPETEDRKKCEICAFRSVCNIK